MPETLPDTCPGCGVDVWPESILECPGCGRLGCCGCMPGGINCICPECEEGEE